MSDERKYAYCVAIEDESAGRICVTEYLADDEDDFIGLSGDAVALEATRLTDDEVGVWVRWEAGGWGAPLADRVDALSIEIVRGQRPE